MISDESTFVSWFSINVANLKINANHESFEDFDHFYKSGNNFFVREWLSKEAILKEIRLIYK